MPSKSVSLLGAILLALLALALMGGCMKGPTYTYDYSVSKPYNISSGEISLKVNSTVHIRINNSGGGEIRFNIDNASLTANLDDGSTETVSASGSEGTIPEDGIYDMNITFSNVPVKLILLDNPPRFHPLIRSYDINVTTRGSQLFLVIWSPEQVTQNNRRITMDDIPLGDYLGRLGDKLSLDEP